MWSVILTKTLPTNKETTAYPQTRPKQQQTQQYQTQNQVDEMSSLTESLKTLLCIPVPSGNGKDNGKGKGKAAPPTARDIEKERIRSQKEHEKQLRRDRRDRALDAMNNY
ncbi:hypothetical protein NPX13_g10461 [Xylaria arbuscula]|uniref:Uncharacterized protein n=1 Tax=Xylaria arbuscula TaxID=114810 RepID=A0A9W8N4S0_9PEZI|nr:hypothetical protein NPX13_g10461 [Xylaria arbuscula]